eukprot:gnl/TRDRNA2_/TRDRNA2_208917_c0_seq1.p1 gnl/TRDRNA2_/TRDRNA2_208917_c0~~gnl/TRDRNA2_/TRDRNA2_208917_c0_seq1.p1  ORF type:complete len:208 (+),score=22.00 gnl/TRDRNA2_/TRDRNA2_208917_c0_seq1:81-704(+)
MLRFLKEFVHPLEALPQVVMVLILCLALGGPLLLLIGGLLFLVHKPHLLVESHAELFAVQNDYWKWYETLQVETYSWCIYSISGRCEEGGVVNTTARRDDVAYNGLTAVPAQRCFDDAEVLDGVDTSSTCLDEDNIVVCHPRPVIRAWHYSGDCNSWTLNDPGTLNTRFTIITAVGAVCFACICCPLCILWGYTKTCGDGFDDVQMF